MIPEKRIPVSEEIMLTKNPERDDDSAHSLRTLHDAAKFNVAYRTVEPSERVARPRVAAAPTPLAHGADSIACDAFRRE